MRGSADGCRHFAVSGGPHGNGGVQRRPWSARGLVLLDSSVVGRLHGEADHVAQPSVPSGTSREEPMSPHHPSILVPPPASDPATGSFAVHPPDLQAMELDKTGTPSAIGNGDSTTPRTGLYFHGRRKTEAGFRLTPPPVVEKPMAFHGVLPSASRAANSPPLAAPASEKRPEAEHNGTTHSAGSMLERDQGASNAYTTQDRSVAATDSRASLRKRAINPCVCENGTPFPYGAWCNGVLPDVTRCASCNQGWHRQDDFDKPNWLSCQPNTCVCEDGDGASIGTPATGYFCPENGGNFCSACVTGRHVHDTLGENFLKCIWNECTCSNGDAATKAACTAHGLERCGVCHTGYVLDDGLCGKEGYKCKCDTGTTVPKGDARCPSNGAVYCTACNNGYYLQGNQCKLNHCTCDNGDATTGTDCPSNGAQRCKIDECHAGYHFQGDFAVKDPPWGTCQPTTCTCPHGTGATGAACVTHLSLQCETCKKGYSLQDKSCVANICKCPNGTPFPPGSEWCGEHDGTSCESCEQGWHRQDNPDEPGWLSCVENVCTCANGQVATGPFCSEHDPDNPKTACSSCNDGLHVHDVMGPDFLKCVTNQCTCAQGTPAVGTACPVHQTEKCVEPCNGGYVFETVSGHGMCNPEVGKQCVCGNGVPVAKGSSLCKNEGDVVCASCYRGFRGLTCEENVCPCAHGTPYKGKDCKDGDPLVLCCETEGITRCKSCESGYRIQDDFNKPDVFSCQPMQCECENGFGASGPPACLSEGDHACSMCNIGFEKSSETCHAEPASVASS
ncbi:unnamed protein product [Amoebophrya sp. A120]|nr:unnamed protein product [Amoebophrya sp. A120]|eukprot:GSA120T00011822001.1